MSSAYSPSWKRLLYKVPFLFKICPEGNYHWKWDRLCFCRCHEYCGDWHGGIWDMKLKKEYQFCSHCVPPSPLYLCSEDGSPVETDRLIK
jgi:hypothetical protein